MPLSYKDAGVDLELYQEAMARIPALANRTHTPRVMPLPGGFAGLFRLQDAAHQYADPVLISGTDGVGTKLKVAIQAGVYDTVGIDLVAMCVNDCLCLGAQPLFFLDYIAMGKDNPDLLAALVKGVSDGCLQAGAALIGGETAIMPDMYAAGDFDMAGFCVGVADRSELITGTAIEAGDVLIAIPSSGVHSNGFSLVRKIVFETAGLTVGDQVPELGLTVGEVLLTPTKIYAALVAEVLKQHRSAIHGIAHITGGGLMENTQRIVPEGLALQVDFNSWERLPVFTWLQKLGDVDPEEMYHVFNMGIGLVLVISPGQVDSVVSTLIASGERPQQIGTVVSR